MSGGLGLILLIVPILALGGASRRADRVRSQTPWGGERR